MPTAIINVNGVSKKSTEIDYDDLVWLYKDFYIKHGKYPISNDLLSKNNLPQWRIVKRILKINNITHNDFLLDVGKVSHVRSSIENYEIYLKRFKEIFVKNGKMSILDLTNNNYGLPSVSWLVENCPDNNVNSWNQFLSWCGFLTNRNMDKELVSERLINYEKRLGRCIKKSDICKSKIGFSMIVINRIWGCFTNCKKDLGLIIKNGPKGYSDDELLSFLDKIIECVKEEGREEITVKYDINFSPYIEQKISSSLFYRALSRRNTTLRDYLESQGLQLANNGNGMCYKYDDGEYVKSMLEYKFTNYIREELNLRYNVDYKRSVLYKSFSDTDSMIDCDYVIQLDKKTIYVEIVGMIKPKYKNCWETTDFNSETKNKYRDHLKLKKKLLEENNLTYYFLFEDDIKKINI